MNGFAPPVAATLLPAATIVLEAVVAGGTELLVYVSELRVEGAVATAVVATTPPGLGLDGVAAATSVKVTAMSITAG